MVSSPWRSRSRLTMVCSLWALTLVFLSLVLSSRLFSRGLMRLASMEGVAGSLKTHHSTRSDTSLMSLDWFWRHCEVTQTTDVTTQNLHLLHTAEAGTHHSMHLPIHTLLWPRVFIYSYLVYQSDFGFHRETLAYNSRLCEINHLLFDSNFKEKMALTVVVEYHQRTYSTLLELLLDFSALDLKFLYTTNILLTLTC